MENLLARHPIPRRVRAVGFDEISVGKGHRYAIVAADLDRHRPIWMSERVGRKEKDANRFYKALGRRRSRKIDLAVMDMWPPFRTATARHAPQARVIYDKFHILSHLGMAMEKLRRMEYRRANEKERKFIKGQRYTLLSHRENLNAKGRRSLALLLKANKCLHKAYLLKEMFGQLWDFSDPLEAREFFDKWKEQLQKQRMKPFEKFAEMVESHWDGIVSYCHPENKVSLGFMEGLNNKIRTIQRRAFGIKDLKYLRLKVLTSYIKDP